MNFNLITIIAPCLQETNRKTSANLYFEWLIRCRNKHYVLFLCINYYITTVCICNDTLYNFHDSHDTKKLKTSVVEFVYDWFTSLKWFHVTQSQQNILLCKQKLIKTRTKLI